MHKIWIALFVLAPCLLAQGDEKNCKEVGGAVLTNFLSKPVPGANTLGTATGDLRGGLGVVILDVNSGLNGSTVIHVQHHWVTESGDTIFLHDAFLTLFPIPSLPNLLAAKYIDGVDIIGGTGRFEGAHGNLAVFGAIDSSQDFGDVILRYQGTICFERSEH